jgi:predicted Rossmann-fold nucleotide-binding protein
MGSHSTKRNDDVYKLVAQLTWRLGQEGYSIVSGGGPGIMEAANLGAYLCASGSASLDTAFAILARSPDYHADPTGYVAAAAEVRRQFPSDSGESLAIPTWAYSDEPTGQFSSCIGKYFANSIREDGLLAIACDGVVFARGSEGTLQEVFQDACHNAYWTFRTRAPMVFLQGSDNFFTRVPSILDVVKAQASRASPAYDSDIAAFSTVQEIVGFIKTHPPHGPTGTTLKRTFGQSNLTLK